jgi:hypothetical protein
VKEAAEKVFAKAKSGTSGAKAPFHSMESNGRAKARPLQGTKVWQDEKERESEGEQHEQERTADDPGLPEHWTGHCAQQRRDGGALRRHGLYP